MSRTKKGVGMGLFVQCLYALSLHLVAVVFGTAIPISLYIFGIITERFGIPTSGMLCLCTSFFNGARATEIKTYHLPIVLQSHCFIRE